MAPLSSIIVTITDFIIHDFLSLSTCFINFLYFIHIRLLQITKNVCYNAIRKVKNYEIKNEINDYVYVYDFNSAFINLPYIFDGWKICSA